LKTKRCRRRKEGKNALRNAALIDKRRRWVHGCQRNRNVHQKKKTAVNLWIVSTKAPATLKKIAGPGRNMTETSMVRNILRNSRNREKPLDRNAEGTHMLNFQPNCKEKQISGEKEIIENRESWTVKGVLRSEPAALKKGGDVG